MVANRLGGDFTGAVLGPGDPEYDAVRRVWNGTIDRRPALIARCQRSGDVAAALRYAVAEGFPVSVRGGGHNVAGTSVADGALLIDLAPMRGVRVDAAAGLVTAEGGCLLGDLDAATTPYGLACPAGVVSHTGLGGLALGGGYGWLARKWGLTCDHLEAAEVVLADGSIVEATGHSHPELLWALRGGGGNFGVVTRFTLRLRPVGPVYLRRAVYPVDRAGPVLAAYQEFAEAQGADLHAVGTLRRAVANAWVPEGLDGRPALHLSTAWFGDPGQGRAATEALHGALAPAGAAEEVLSYAALQALGDTSEPHGHRYYTKSCYLTGMSAAADELAAATTEIPAPLSTIDFEFLRGAIAKGGAESAFPNRDAPYICTASAHWTDAADDDRNAAWSRRTIGRLDSWRHDGVYVNYQEDHGNSRAMDTYGGPRYRQLAEVKGKYDPRNLFRGNQNIRPSE
ncbi:FAD-binding oxidoreductase [Streptomyces formicae]|uniref:FAD linked oxidase-like n=1 Tax=Streptomyces formicae TaxID=1616117 RepID=A0A291QHN1_9ACTN|nr:FAD-binding oxidoreductase [Streptomyces formicae]ATL31027.1 FAD linked oxidase-like [Streptomyces formicae]